MSDIESKLEKSLNALFFWAIKVGRIQQHSFINKGKITIKNNELIFQPDFDIPISLSGLYKPFSEYWWYYSLFRALDLISIPYMRPFSFFIKKYKFFFYGFAYRMAVNKNPELHVNILNNCIEPQLLFKRERKLRFIE